MNSNCSCSEETPQKEIVRLSPHNEERISLPHAFTWEPVDSANQYVLMINEIRGETGVCIKETKETQIVLEETDLDASKNYFWHLEVLDEAGRTIVSTQGPCGTTIYTFAIHSAEEQVIPANGRKILLDFSHRESDIRGLGVYNFSQYTAYELLRKSGFEVDTNPDRKLWSQLICNYNMLILHCKYGGPLVPFIPSEIEAITEYVSNGGNLFVLCWGGGGGVNGPDLYNPLLKGFDIELKPLPDAKFRTAENLATEIFQEVNKIYLQCPAEIVENGHEVLASSETGERLLVRANYGKGTVLVSAMGMAFQDSYMGGADEEAFNNQRAFLDLINNSC